MFDSDRRAQRQLAKELKREAAYFADVISRRLAQLGFDHWYKRAERDIAPMRTRDRRALVQFLEARSNQNVHYLRLDLRNLPYGVRESDFKQDWVIDSLSNACGRPVEYDSKYESGAWFLVMRDNTVRSIPASFAFKNALTNIPINAPTLTFCAGVTQNNTLVHRNLARGPHLLIAGATGTGKSTMLNTILISFLWRNPPEKVKLLLVDLKGGLELGAYGHAPHLLAPIVTEPGEVLPALKTFKAEIDKRQEFLRGKAANMQDWNKKHPTQRLPYILLVIDELAQIMYDREIRRDAEAWLAGLMAVSRAAGGHVILCTQSPRREVVSGLIKANIDMRIAFSCASGFDSRVIIDSQAAANLPHAGRAVLKQSDKLIPFQAPWLPHERIPGMVDKIRGKYREKLERQAVSNQAILEFALNERGGSLAWRPIWEKFSEHLTSREIVRTISALENQIVEVGGQPYRVTPPKKDRQPWRLEEVEKETENGRGGFELRA